MKIANKIIGNILGDKCSKNKSAWVKAKTTQGEDAFYKEGNVIVIHTPGEMGMRSKYMVGLYTGRRGSRTGKIIYMDPNSNAHDPKPFETIIAPISANSEKELKRKIAYLKTEI